MNSSSAPSGESRRLPIPQAPPVVFVVDDDISVRESLELLIRYAGWQPETFASAQEFLARPRVDVPSCLVLDVALPDLNGLDLQKRVVDRTDMPIIFITGHGDVPTTVQAMKAGAVEFLTKPFGEEAMLNAIRHAIERSQTALEQKAEKQALRERYASLSAREREVMALVVSGLLNKQVAAGLGISEITVKAHRGQMMRKMKADSVRQPGENGREARPPADDETVTVHTAGPSWNALYSRGGKITLVDSPFYFCRTAVWTYHQDSKCCNTNNVLFLFRQSHGSQHFLRHN
jgi:FixJ family two-component response regulator